MLLQLASQDTSGRGRGAAGKVAMHALSMIKQSIKTEVLKHQAVS